MHALVARDIHRSFASGTRRLEVLRGVSLTVEPGAVVSVVGASGSGKSTLLQILGGLDRPDRGKVEVSGCDVHALSDRAKARFRAHTMGFVFQFHHLLPDFSALENVMIPGLIAGGKRRDVEARARELLAQVGLSERVNHKPAHLSGGEQQRVAVARALMNAPKIILADEPSGNLDPQTAASLEELLWRMVREQGTSMVVVTHDQDLARRADVCYHLVDGRLEEAFRGRAV